MSCMQSSPRWNMISGTHTLMIRWALFATMGSCDAPACPSQLLRLCKPMIWLTPWECWHSCQATTQLLLRSWAARAPDVRVAVLQSSHA